MVRECLWEGEGEGRVMGASNEPKRWEVANGEKANS